MLFARGLLGVACLTGCDSVFGLDSLYEPEHFGQVINDPDGDVDNDGEPNATDLCALVPATDIGGRSDRDMDGVGDLCDPRPDTPGDCLALFDSFEAPALSSHWKFEGETVTSDSGRLNVPGGDETIVYLDTPLDLDAVHLRAYVPIGANAGGPRHAIQVFMSATNTPLVSGTACSAESDTQASRVAIVDVKNGADQVTRDAPVGDILIGAGTSLGLAWTDDGCTAELSTDTSEQSATVPIAPPPGGVFMVRVLDAGLSLYVIAGYGRGCSR